MFYRYCSLYTRKIKTYAKCMDLGCSNFVALSQQLRPRMSEKILSSISKTWNTKSLVSSRIGQILARCSFKQDLERVIVDRI